MDFIFKKTLLVVTVWENMAMESQEIRSKNNKKNESKFFVSHEYSFFHLKGDLEMIEGNQIPVQYSLLKK